MPEKMILANWKMNLTPQKCLALTKEVTAAFPSGIPKNIKLVLAPPYAALWPIRELCKPYDISIAAQDVFQEDKGPYCGAVCASMLQEFCEYVVIGHSDRRIRFGETDELLHQKLRSVLACGMKPILCIGETANERRLGLTLNRLEYQLKVALDGVHDPSDITVLYEPVWAMGTGQAMNGEAAADLIFSIREILRNMYGRGHVRIIYAGSVNENNAAEYACNDTISGVALGSSAVSAPSIISIIKTFLSESAKEVSS